MQGLKKKATFSQFSLENSLVLAKPYILRASQKK